MKQIILAETMGFCWGVRRTLEIVKGEASTQTPIAMLGDVIHNPNVVADLHAHGVDSADNLDAAVALGYRRVGTTAHGAGPERAAQVSALGLELVDTTCPLVTRVQRLAEKLVRQGYFLIIFGDPKHPEARGIYGWAQTRSCIIAKSVDELPWQRMGTATLDGADEDLAPPRKVAVLSQTTKSGDEFLAFAGDVVSLVTPYGGEVRVCNTICAPTLQRQEALRELTSKVDAIIVVGGKKSSNTTRLAELSRNLGTPSYHIEGPDEIEQDWLANVERIGVTAGASTPDNIIQAVVTALENHISS